MRKHKKTSDKNKTINAEAIMIAMGYKNTETANKYLKQPDKTQNQK